MKDESSPNPTDDPKTTTSSTDGQGGGTSSDKVPLSRSDNKKKDNKG